MPDSSLGARSILQLHACRVVLPGSHDCADAPQLLLELMRSTVDLVVHDEIKLWQLNARESCCQRPAAEPVRRAVAAGFAAKSAGTTLQPRAQPLRQAKNPKNLHRAAPMSSTGTLV